jgi:hypothetical protein
MVWSVIAAVASVFATIAALATVKLTVGYRREERLRVLAEALTNVVVAAEDFPGFSDRVALVAASKQLTEALRQLDRVAALSLLGLSAQISEPIIALMDPSVRRKPKLAFALGTQAFERLLEEHRPRKSLRVRWRERKADKVIKRLKAEAKANAEATGDDAPTK